VNITPHNNICQALICGPSLWHTHHWQWTAHKTFTYSQCQTARSQWGFYIFTCYG